MQFVADARQGRRGEAVSGSALAQVFADVRHAADAGVNVAFAGRVGSQLIEDGVRHAEQDAGLVERGLAGFLEGQGAFGGALGDSAGHSEEAFDDAVDEVETPLALPDRFDVSFGGPVAADEEEGVFRQAVNFPVGCGEQGLEGQDARLQVERLGPEPRGVRGGLPAEIAAGKLFSEDDVERQFRSSPEPMGGQAAGYLKASAEDLVLHGDVRGDDVSPADGVGHDEALPREEQFRVFDPPHLDLAGFGDDAGLVDDVARADVSQARDGDARDVVAHVTVLGDGQAAEHVSRHAAAAVFDDEGAVVGDVPEELDVPGQSDEGAPGGHLDPAIAIRRAGRLDVGGVDDLEASGERGESVGAGKNLAPDLDLIHEGGEEGPHAGAGRAVFDAARELECPGEKIQFVSFERIDFAGADPVDEVAEQPLGTPALGIARRASGSFSQASICSRTACCLAGPPETYCRPRTRYGRARRPRAKGRCVGLRGRWR